MCFSTTLFLPRVLHRYIPKRTDWIQQRVHSGILRRIILVGRRRFALARGTPRVKKAFIGMVPKHSCHWSYEIRFKYFVGRSGISVNNYLLLLVGIASFGATNRHGTKKKKNIYCHNSRTYHVHCSGKLLAKFTPSQSEVSEFHMTDLDLKPNV